MHSNKAIFETKGELILASASPRRRRFLSEIGLKFAVRAAQVDERVLPGEKAGEFVKRVSLDKAGVVALESPGAWVLAADTAVVLAEEILGKPQSSDGAVRMLMRLSGREHDVWTGFCLLNRQLDIIVQRAVQTKVWFAEQPEEVCRAYVGTGEPLDKAGGYGIQGKGGFMVRRIAGSYSNVVGLPLAEVLEELIRFGVISPAV